MHVPLRKLDLTRKNFITHLSMRCDAMQKQINRKDDGKKKHTRTQWKMHENWNNVSKLQLFLVGVRLEYLRYKLDESIVPRLFWDIKLEKATFLSGSETAFFLCWTTKTIKKNSLIIMFVDWNTKPGIIEKWKQNKNKNTNHVKSCGVKML